MGKSQKRYWMCRKCGSRWERTYTKCQNEGCSGKKPKARVPKHARTLQEDSYERYVELNELIHDVKDESCAVCGRPRSQEVRHHRDHGHNKTEVTFGRPRGLACWTCNSMMPRQLTLVQAERIAAYLRRAESFWLAQGEEKAA